MSLSHPFVCSKTVTTSASTTEKLNSLLAIPGGATHITNYKTQDYSAEVKKVTEGWGIDVLTDVMRDVDIKVQMLSVIVLLLRLLLK